MYAMQYAITLPSDYDMGIIRARVATRGALLDEFPGLALKAYCVRVRHEHGSPVNQYAPFYLWASIAGMNHFLWGGGGFRGVIDSFGRPVVCHWTGIACARGPACAARPRAATRRTEVLSPDVDPAAYVAHARNELARLAETPGVHTTAIALDPANWELLHFTLWERDTPADAEIRYEVLHVCSPHLDEIVAAQDRLDQAPHGQ